MSIDAIKIKGARVHNLKNINVTIPRDKLVVLTGLSGSGKSSLAFDTIYAEGQRRYVESLSSYARQFLEMQDKPDVDLIEGLSPAISIEQKTTSKNPRSIVATVTEIYDYLRLLYARVGQPFCYNCNKEIAGKSASQIIDSVTNLPSGSKLSILSPIVRERKGEYKKELADLQKEGFVRVRVDGEVRYLEEDIQLNPKTKHSIEIVVDRVVNRSDDRARIADAIELALKHSGGLVIIIHHKKEADKEELYSEHFSCLDCGISYPEIEPRTFSFNAPQGACGKCKGLGTFMDFDESLIVPDHALSLKSGAIKPWGGTWASYYSQMLKSLCADFDMDVNAPWAKLPKSFRNVVLFGSGRKKISFDLKSSNGGMQHKFTKKFEGVISSMQRRHMETESDKARESLEKYMRSSPCEVCEGKRLKKESQFVRVVGHSIIDVIEMSVKEASDFFSSMQFEGSQEKISKPILKEITSRLGFLLSVGLDYLTLDRKSGTLSGGEAQRIRLATQIGSALVGVLYVLDEPSIGLHQRDNERLLKTLKHLRDLGNTVLVVEHDEDTIQAADEVVDLGPGAGSHGGKIVAQGTAKEIAENSKSITGAYLSGRVKIEVPQKRREGNGKHLTLRGATGNNLQNVDLDIPLGKLICITGVSGSGKSSLTVDTFYKGLVKELDPQSRAEPLPYKSFKGVSHIDKIIDIDQSPIGRTPRSNPVTYTGAMDDIRALFSSLPEAKVRGYDPGRFSFNVKGGRCENCRGGGVIRIEMNFLADVYVTCDACKGSRFNRETLEVLYRGKSISDVLNMTVDDASEFFKAVPRIQRRLQLLKDVGMGYIHLGQQATTLSGGEAQRVKLSKELAKRSTGKTLYILDEPTTGLHFHDVAQLIVVLQRLVDEGNTVVVIEHNLDVIKVADHVVDLGPEGGHRGGLILVAGTPEDVAKCKKSYTGKFLKKMLS